MKKIESKISFQQYLKRIHNKLHNKRHRTNLFKQFLTTLPKDKVEVIARIKLEEKQTEEKQQTERKKNIMALKMIDASGNYKPIDLDKASIEEMSEWYNKYTGFTQIKRFNDRDLAIKRCLETKKAMDEMQARANSPTGTSKKAKTIIMKAKQAEKKAEKKAAKGKKAPAKTSGAKSSIRDMKITKVAKENPRREGTEGYKSWEKIKSGMTYLQAIDAGARNVDIRCDVEKGNLKLVKA